VNKQNKGLGSATACKGPDGRVPLVVYSNSTLVGCTVRSRMQVAATFDRMARATAAPVVGANARTSLCC
jgi:hypothetical protein